VYASENSSLAILETLIHVADRNLPRSLVAVRITIPSNAHVTKVAVSDLPATWRDVDNPQCIALGTQWIESRVGLVLRVPSAANSLEESVLLNPLHPDIERCHVDDGVGVVFDPRVVGFVQP
jgi:RES domain-containing protein